LPFLRYPCFIISNVDNFFAATAALATALVIRGIRRASFFLTFSGIITSAFCLFIKPAGIIVMTTVFLAWLVHVWEAYQLPQGVEQRDRRVRKYLFFSLSIFVFMYTLVVSLSLTSRYLSAANIDFGKRAIELIKSEFPAVNWWPLLWKQIHSSFGWHWLTLVVSACVLSLWLSGKQLHRKKTGGYGERGAVDLLSASGVVLLQVLYS